MESPRLILPDLSTKQHIDTESSRATRQSSDTAVKLYPQPGRRSPTDDHLKSGAVTERSTRTAHVNGSHTFSQGSINQFDEISSSQVHKSGALTDRGTRTDHQRNALKSSGSWRPRRESRGPLVQFLLRSAWGSAAVDGTPRRELEDIVKETCGEDPQTSARSAEAESLEVAVDALQKSYNNVKNTIRAKSTQIAALSGLLRDLQEESGDAAQERSSKRLPELEEPRKRFMSRPSLAYLGLSSDEDPGACADKMQALADEEERQLRIRIHCQQRSLWEKAKLLDQQKQQKELLHKLSIEFADRSHSLQIQHDEEEKAKASIATFNKRIEALAKARSRVAEAIVLRQAAFRDLQRKLEERRQHKEQLIHELRAQPGKALQKEAFAVEKKERVVGVLKAVDTAIHRPRSKDGHMLKEDDLNGMLRRYEDNQKKHQMLEKEIAAAEAKKRQLQATKEALEAALNAASCVPQRPSEVEETRQEMADLEQRQSAAQKRQEEAVRNWAEQETHLAAVASGFEGLLHTIDGHSPLLDAAGRSNAVSGGAALADVMLTLELRVEDVLVPKMAQAESNAPLENRSKPVPKDGDAVLLETMAMPTFVNYRLGKTGPKGTPPESRRSSARVGARQSGFTLLAEAYLEGKAAATRRAQTAAMARRLKGDSESKLQTQLSLYKTSRLPSRKVE